MVSSPIAYSSLESKDQWTSGPALSIYFTCAYVCIYNIMLVLWSIITLLVSFLMILFRLYLADIQSIRAILIRLCFCGPACIQLCLNVCQVKIVTLLADIDMRQQEPRISDMECAYRLSKNPQYALSEDSILRIIKWSKRRG